MISMLWIAHMTKFQRLYVNISRVAVIKRLVQKKYKAKRPTAKQINEVIKDYDLNLYQIDGKKRSREVIGKALAKALNSLK